MALPLDIHYAMSTGSLRAAVAAAEFTLRLGLESKDNRKDPHYLRMTMEMALHELQQALQDQAQRDGVQNANR